LRSGKQIEEPASPARNVMNVQPLFAGQEQVR
jgi:hypothetical protein